MQSDKPKTQITIQDFTGIELGSDALDLPPGKAQDQVNIQSDQRGAMQCRMGTRLVSWDSETQ